MRRPGAAGGDAVTPPRLTERAEGGPDAGPGRFWY